MPIDSVERGAAADQRPSSARRARTAAEIEDRVDDRGAWQRADDLTGHEEMKGTVEQRESGALPGAVERAARCQLRAALDVAGRQRAQRTCDLRGRQVREVALVERAEPRVDGVLN